jgi:meiotic recombination protein REC8
LLARLVATLGSKSNLKKVSRKAILDVDVVKTCDTIIEPAVPMALRLSSNLLWVAFAFVGSSRSRRGS